jgi:UDP-4-amino-4-deoxy-L-arabinose-oxoglutarate aminotransferase
MSAGAADRFKDGQYKHWGMDRLGTKANLPDLLACFLPEQIQEIDSKLHIREELAQKYEKEFNGTSISFAKKLSNVIHSRHLFPIHVSKNARDEVLKLLGENGIGTTVNYRSVHTMNYYRKKYQLKESDFPVSENWGSGTISIPLFPGMSEEEQNYVIDVLKSKAQKLIGSI